MRRRREDDDYESENLYTGKIVQVNGTNKILWAVVGFLGLIYLAVQGIVGAKVFDISDRLARVETRLETPQ